MVEYEILPVNLIKLDKRNPRIANYLSIHDKNDLSSEVMALLLGTTSEACSSLRESIKEYGGVVHPIIVNKEQNGTYVVIEGNTRLQIYRDFLSQGVSGEWSKIKAIVYENLEEENIHSIRLQAHLVGPREWDSYAKAKYLYTLLHVEMMPLNILVSFCGGTTKASSIKSMIQAYSDMETYYRPLCDDDTVFDVKKFQGFVELQRKNIAESLALHNYSKSDFSKWIIDDKIVNLADIRRLPEILNSKKASHAFLNGNSREALKVIIVEEFSVDKLNDVPYELLAEELANRMISISLNETRMLRDDTDYSNKLDSLKRAYSELKFILNEIEEV